MDAEAFLSRVREDEGLTSDLDEAEATELLSWLDKRVGAIVAKAPSEEAAWEKVEALCKRCRSLVKSVAAARDGDAEGAQAGVKELGLKFPASGGDNPGELLRQLLAQEAKKKA